MSRSKHVEPTSKFDFRLLDTSTMELVNADNKSLEQSLTILENRKVYKLVQILEVQSQRGDSNVNSSIHTKDPGPYNCSFVIEVNNVDLMSIEEEAKFNEDKLKEEASLNKLKIKKK